MFLYTDDSRCELLPLHAITVGTDYHQTRIDRPDGFWAHHVFCVEEGSGVFETPRGKTVLGAGSVLFIRKGYPTCYYPEKDLFRVGFITFDGDGVERLLEYYRAEDFMTCQNDALVRMIGHCARLGSRNASPDRLSKTLYEILVSFFGELQAQRSTSPVTKARNFIEQNCYDSELSVEDIARAAGISPSLLFRLFREQEQISPADYLRDTRIRRAKQLLIASPEMRIAEVAQRCGFSGSAYFCKVFRAQSNMTPKEFQAAHVH